MRPSAPIAAAVLSITFLAGMGPQDSAAQPRKPAPTSPFGQPDSTNSKSKPVPPRSSPATPHQTPAPAGQAPAPAAPTDQAPEPAPLSANAEAACQVLTTFLTRAASGQTYSAVDEFVDIPGFERLALKNNIDKLDRSQRAYVDQLSSVLFKSLICGAAFTVALKDNPIPPFTVVEQGDQVRISFTQTWREGPHETTFTLHNTRNGWRIIDLEPVANRAYTAFSQLHADPSTTPAFMEGLVGGLISGKFEGHTQSARKPSLSDQDRRERQQATVDTMLQTLNNQLELFKVRTGHYPDLIAHGWDELIKGGYIKTAPVNPVNGRSEICAGLRGKANFGWTWNATTGTLGACYYDEKALALTPDSP
jgi:hypothetical protein